MFHGIINLGVKKVVKLLEKEVDITRVKERVAHEVRRLAKKVEKD